MTSATAKEVFNAALEHPPAERAAFVRGACGDDAELRARVERLLAAHDRGSDFLASPTGDGATLTTPGAPSEGPGAVIGRYRLLEQIGEGGFGAVFMAEQREPVVRRVALKIIKLGMDTKQVTARFEAERQALAMMDHPGIARVLDGGATGSGRPYFVMELVRGEPITAYCDAHALGVPERLALFQQVCHAVQHAHQKGIIHRDLKPSNVLVCETDGRPTPRIIDFGIAKATGGTEGLTDRTLFTDFRQFLGTPEYMSPEQAGMGGDIDTRSDIYSLGVLLYELLTGGPPFDAKRLRSAAWEEMRRIIREDEPQRPSTRLHSRPGTLGVAVRRREPARLAGLVRGDLDWIVMKCLEKDRARRYETASGLAMDVARHLAGEPVLAAPPSRAYRVHKFLRRYRGRVVAATLVGASLLVAVAGTATFAVREARRADQINNVADFQARMLSGIDVPRMGARLREDLLDEATRERRRAHASEEEIAEFRTGLEEHLEGVNFTALALRSLDQNVFEPTLASVKGKFADEPQVQARLLQHLATTLSILGLFNRATGAQTEAIEIRRRALGGAHPETLASIAQMAAILNSMRRPDEAEAYAREALDGRRRVLGRDHPDTLASTGQLGFILRWQGAHAAAEPLLREALSGSERVLGADHPDTIFAMQRLAQFLSVLSPDEAEPYAAEAIERRERSGTDDPRTVGVQSVMALIREAQGRLDEAAWYYRESLERSRAARGEDHRDVLNLRYRLGALLKNQGKLAEAEVYLNDAFEGLRRVQGPTNVDTLISARLLADLLDAIDRSADAADLRSRCVAEAMDALRGSEGDPPVLAEAFHAMLCRVTGGERLRSEYLDLCRAAYGAIDPRTLGAMNTLAWHLSLTGRLSEAEPLARLALDGFRVTLKSPNRGMRSALDTLATILRDMGRPMDALPLYEEEKRAARATTDEGRRDPDIWIRHAECLALLQRFADAERELLECHAGLAAARQGTATDAVVRSLVETYEAWHAFEPGGGHDARAAMWRARLSSGAPHGPGEPEVAPRAVTAPTGP